VLLLRYQDDLTYEEIAAVIGCSVGTVKSRLHHARRRLQSEYANSRGNGS
jgi:RNA polymerase sigma-70 factor (ECF subfamily)